MLEAAKRSADSLFEPATTVRAPVERGVLNKIVGYLRRLVR
ncbi:MAG: hypothetical protein N2441_08095 [Rhodocyclaceae bacterium]|nr:hypothetical protein [Rhodocyclaceae bacterium]